MTIDFKPYLRDRRVWAAGAVVLLLAGLLARCGAARPSVQVGGEAATARAVRGALVSSVRASGEIRSKNSNKISPPLRRTATLAWLVAEGAKVEKDELVAQFNTEELEQRIKDAENKLAEQEAKLLTEKASYDIQEMDNATNLKLAEQQVTTARLELEKFFQGDQPNELRSARLKVDATESKQGRSEKRHVEARELLAEGFITEDQVEEERIAMETARVDRESAALELTILTNFTHTIKRAGVENNLAKAENELEKTRKKNEVQLNNRRQAVNSAQRAVDRAKAEVDNLKEELLAYEVRSPAPGVVTYGDPDSGWRRAEIIVGAQLQPGQVLMTIPDMSAMQAVINVPEAIIHKVATGQVAHIEVEASPGTSYSGVVTRVAEVANPSGWMAAAVKEFRVEVTLGEGNGLKPGYSCDADIITDVIPSALQLPIQAIFRDHDRPVVYLARGAQREVAVGRSSVTHIEVVSGLDEGDKVLLSKPVTEGERKP